MKAYAVMSVHEDEYGDEGYMFLGVYSTLEKADAMAFAAVSGAYEDVAVMAVDVDSPVTDAQLEDAIIGRYTVTKTITTPDYIMEARAKREAEATVRRALDESVFGPHGRPDAAFCYDPEFGRPLPNSINPYTHPEEAEKVREEWRAKLKAQGR